MPDRAEIGQVIGAIFTWPNLAAILSKRRAN